MKIFTLAFIIQDAAIFQGEYSSVAFVQLVEVMADL